jgi:CPA2 family monovalent cation:H+ antiporter-2
MGHLPSLIQDLALILFTGAIVTMIFKKIKQPVVLGYIIAGFLVGPHLSITPTVVDLENVETLAEIGVIFLLFSLGLEFSFKKLIRVGGSASITAFVEIIFITSAGYLVGKWMGWSTMDSVFLGGMLASSSTTIIIKAFDELGIKGRQFASIVFGVLVVEDIVVILLMVLLSTMAVSQAFEGTELLMTVLKLLFFLSLWFIMGIFLLPTLLKKTRDLLDEETLLILAIGLCLGMVLLATQVGFSAELGAFIMGSIIAETTSAERVEHLTKPVKNLFGAVFFVSVGMLIDPVTIMEYKWQVLIVTMLTLFGKLFSTTLGALLSGQPLKQSIQVGMSMAQIGEFAFIVATLGLSLGVISDFLFPVAVGASAITTFTTPYLIKLSEPCYNAVVRVLPPRFIKAIERYSSGTQSIKTENQWQIVLKSYITIVLTNGIILFALLLLSINFLLPLLHRHIEDDNLANLVGLVISLAIAAPFIWALMVKKQDSKAYRSIWLNERYNRGPLFIIELSRFVIGLAIIAIWVNWLLSTLVAVLVAIPATIGLMYYFSKGIQSFYQRLEGRFISNLNARETEGGLPEDVLQARSNIREGLSPWTAQIIDMQVNPHAEYVGKTLVELQWREEYGINIAYIKRGENLILAPGRNNKLLPFDHVGIIATDEQMQLFKPVFDTVEQANNSDTSVQDIVLQKIAVNEYNKLHGKSIRDSDIRGRTNGLVIGIERGETRMLNPESTMIFQRGDIVWIVGERKKIQELSGKSIK